MNRFVKWLSFHTPEHYIHRVVASLGNPSRLSAASRPILPGASEFLLNASPCVLTPLSLVAGPLRESPPPPYDISLSILPDPTLTVLGSLLLKSEVVGGSSGKGRFERRSSIKSFLFFEFSSITDLILLSHHRHGHLMNDLPLEVMAPILQARCLGSSLKPLIQHHEHLPL